MHTTIVRSLRGHEVQRPAVMMLVGLLPVFREQMSALFGSAVHKNIRVCIAHFPLTFLVYCMVCTGK